LVEEVQPSVSRIKFRSEHRTPKSKPDGGQADSKQTSNAERRTSNAELEAGAGSKELGRKAKTLKVERG
jgi:hypothetical protein